MNLDPNITATGGIVGNALQVNPQGAYSGVGFNFATTPGQTYQVEFDLYQGTVDASDNMQLWIFDNAFNTLNTYPLGAVQSGHYTFTFVGDATASDMWVKPLFISGNNTPANTSTVHFNHYFSVDNFRVTTPNTSLQVVDTYSAEILETHDYYAFGYDMPGRSVNQDYRYGFNGKEEDKWNGNHGAYGDFGARMYDERLGKWMSQDAHSENYPSYSPYHFGGNNPIVITDVDGKDWGFSITEVNGVKTLNITFTGAVINTSKNKSFSTAQIVEMIKNQINDVFANTPYGANINFTADLRAIVSTSEIKSTDHVIEIADGDLIPGNAGGITQFYGKHIVLNEGILYKVFTGADKNRVSHEILHSAGLVHYFDIMKNPDYTSPYEWGQLIVPHNRGLEPDGLSMNVMNYPSKDGDLINTQEYAAKQVLNKSQIAFIVANFNRGALNVNNIVKKEIDDRKARSKTGKGSAPMVNDKAKAIETHQSVRLLN